MFLEAGLINERKIGGEDIVDRLSIKHSDKEGNHALGDDGVGVGDVVDFAVCAGGFEPDLRLAPLDQAVAGVKIFGHRRELFSETDDVFVALLPVLEEVEFVENLLLFVRNAHGGGMGRVDEQKCTRKLKVAAWNSVRNCFC